MNDLYCPNCLSHPALGKGSGRYPCHTCGRSYRYDEAWKSPWEKDSREINLLRRCEQVLPTLLDEIKFGEGFAAPIYKKAETLSKDIEVYFHGSRN